MIDIEARRDELEHAMLQPENYSDGKKMVELSRKLDSVNKELIKVEAEWTAMIESVE